MNRRARVPRSPLRAHGVPFWVVTRRRASLISLAGAVSCSLGCLADPPTFAPRGQIPPFIIAGQVEPPLGAIHEGTSERSIAVNVPFRSEDVNTDLAATFYLDLVPGAQGVLPGSVQGFARVSAGNFEEVRQLSTAVNLNASRGCHSLTLIMTYDDNLDQTRGDLPLDEERAARVVWWLNVDDDDGETLMVDCPRESQVDVGGG